MDQAPASDLRVWNNSSVIAKILVWCWNISLIPYLFLYVFLSFSVDVGSWREGGGRNLNVAPSPSEMDNKASEEVGVGGGTPSPPGDSEEPGKPATGEKRDVRDRLSAPTSQHKVNGGQQPPGGVTSQFHAQFRNMMPPYVSDKADYPCHILSIDMSPYGLL